MVNHIETLKKSLIERVLGGGAFFWPKNYGEKWSRKIYFEVPPCGKIVIFVTEFVIFLKSSK